MNEYERQGDKLLGNKASRNSTASIKRDQLFARQIRLRPLLPSFRKIYDLAGAINSRVFLLRDESPALFFPPQRRATDDIPEEFDDVRSADARASLSSARVSQFFSECARTELVPSMAISDAQNGAMGTRQVERKATGLLFAASTS